MPIFIAPTIRALDPALRRLPARPQDPKAPGEGFPGRRQAASPIRPATFLDTISITGRFVQMVLSPFWPVLR